MKDKFIVNLAEILEISSNSISSSDVFRELENWDSITALGVSAMIDEEYEITIPRVDFDKLITVEDLYNYIKKTIKNEN